MTSKNYSNIGKDYSIHLLLYLGRLRIADVDVAPRRFSLFQWSFAASCKIYDFFYSFLASELQFQRISRIAEIYSARGELWIMRCFCCWKMDVANVPPYIFELYEGNPCIISKTWIQYQYLPKDVRLFTKYVFKRIAVILLDPSEGIPLLKFLTMKVSNAMNFSKLQVLLRLF
jgi:hypothetical protein